MISLTGAVVLIPGVACSERAGLPAPIAAVEPLVQPTGLAMAVPTWFDPAATRHDFGIVLAGADVVRSHTYRILNRSEQPVRVRGVANRKPCCGVVAAVPAKVVEPGQAIEVPVRLKIAWGAGPVAHVAAIELDGGEVVELVTTVRAQPSATVAEAEPLAGVLELEQTRRVEYLVQSFGTAADPPAPLDDRAIRCELPSAWAAPASVTTDPATGLTVIRRTLMVTIPASREPGPRVTSLEVLNGGGLVIGRGAIRWETAAALAASPAGLIFCAEYGADGDRKILIRSRDGLPFRVVEAATGVAGLTVAGDNDRKPSHTLAAHLVAVPGVATRAGEVVIRTDHPVQPMIKLAVYVAGRGADPAAAAPNQERP